MTTYVLGAGASFHAGYPLCSALWSKMAIWVIESQPHDSEYRQAVEMVGVLNGPVVDVEDMFTNLDLGRGVFQALAEDELSKLKGKIHSCLADYFKGIWRRRPDAPLYRAFANRVAKGDRIITFNYDVSLENELIGVRKFGVKNGYGFEADWDEADSEVKVLKLHGSINWIGSIFGGRTRGTSGVDLSHSLGRRPFVDNLLAVSVGGEEPVPDSFFRAYPSRVLDKEFPGGGVASDAPTLTLPTYEKKFSVETSGGDEWAPFYESLWSQAAESLEQSDRIVIIGYSMPEADHRSRAVLLWGSNKRAEVLLCCAASNETLKGTFETHGFWKVVAIGGFSDFIA
jgi:hypothetical protein